MKLSGTVNFKDLFFAAAIGLSVFFYIFLTSHLIGFVRDEGFYMKAASIKADWFEFIEESFGKEELAEPFSKKSIDKYFKYNNEHPTLIKTMFGFSQYLFERKLGWMSFAQSARFVAALFAALTAMMIYFFGLLFFNRFTAVVSPVMFFLMPHIFFHSHLACFDMPILFFWSGTFILYAVNIKTRSKSSGILTAVFFGLAMAAKHNVFFIPPLLFAGWLALYLINYKKQTEFKGLKGFFRAVPNVYYYFAAVSLPVYFISWPWIWFDTVNRFIEYFYFHAKHVNYTNYYFGNELARGPFPFSFPWAMTFFTTPLPQLIFFISGIYYLSKKVLTEQSRNEKEVNFVFIAGSLFPIFLIALPTVPIFGGIKHWFTGYPLMMTAGVFYISSEMKKMVGKNELFKTVAVSIIFVLSAVSLIPLNVKFAKRGAAFYNQLIGGAQGAAEFRMQRNFWGYDILELVDELNRKAPEKSTVFVMGGYEGLNWNSFLYLKKEGIIRSDINGTNNLKNADFAFFFYEKQNEHMLNQIALEFGSAKAIAVSETDSVFYSALFGREK
ncbi:MAG TPA: glycosyltransferase family 39 protein [bacterium]|nr:glycosyltransferase family 39 protein [bacterium]